MGRCGDDVGRQLSVDTERRRAQLVHHRAVEPDRDPLPVRSEDPGHDQVDELRGDPLSVIGGLVVPAVAVVQRAEDRPTGEFDVRDLEDTRVDPVLQDPGERTLVGLLPPAAVRPDACC